MRKGYYDAIDVEIKNLMSIQSSAVYGHNKFSDWSKAEYERLLGLKNMPAPEIDPKSYAPQPNTNQSAGSKNWVAEGKVVPVKDQA